MKRKPIVAALALSSVALAGLGATARAGVGHCFTDHPDPGLGYKALRLCRPQPPFTVNISQHVRFPDFYLLHLDRGQRFHLTLIMSNPAQAHGSFISFGVTGACDTALAFLGNSDCESRSVAGVSLPDLTVFCSRLRGWRHGPPRASATLMAPLTGWYQIEPLRESVLNPCEQCPSTCKYTPRGSFHMRVA